jgi:glycosyltransferase involved in cell wall biosynthesis
VNGVSLHVVTSDARRGAETFAVDLAGTLEAAGNVARVIALSPSGMQEAHDLPALGPTRRSLSTLTALRHAARRADVVVAHGSSTLEACAVGLAGSGIPFVYRTIGDPAYWVREGFRRRRVGWMLRRAERHVVLWADAADHLARAYGIPAANIDVIPNAVAEDRFPFSDPAARSAARRRFGVPPGLPCLAFVGALSPEKDVGSLVDALAHLPDARLLVAGDGSERPSLETRSEQVAPGRVTFLGSIADPREVYAAADLLLLPSLSEGMPAVVIEAGLVGTPSVATAVGAVPEMIEDGRTGFLVTPQDPGALASKVMEALPRGEEVGQQAREAFTTRFGLHAVARQWATVIEQAALSRRQR